MANKLRNSERVPFDFEDGLMIKGKNIESDAGAELIGHKSALLPSRKLDQILDDIQPITAALTLHISPTGSDTTGDGTSSNPWYSPHRALDWLSTRSINEKITSIEILAAPGEYNFSSTIRMRREHFGIQLAINGANILKPITYEIEGEDQWFAPGSDLVFTTDNKAAAKAQNNAKARTVWATVFNFPANTRAIDSTVSFSLNRLAIIGHGGAGGLAISQCRMVINNCYISGFSGGLSSALNSSITGANIIITDCTSAISAISSACDLFDNIIICNCNTGLTLSGSWAAVGNTGNQNFKIKGIDGNALAIFHNSYFISRPKIYNIKNYGIWVSITSSCHLTNTFLDNIGSLAVISEHSSYVIANTLRTSKTKSALFISTLNSLLWIVDLLAEEVTSTGVCSLSFGSVMHISGSIKGAFDRLINASSGSYCNSNSLSYENARATTIINSDTTAKIRVPNFPNVTYVPVLNVPDSVGSMNFT